MKRISSPGFLILGDVLMLGLVTIFGFASHGTLWTASWRMVTTFLPLMISWICLASPARLFNLESAQHGGNLWKPLWGMLFASTMAAVLRGLWLQMPIQPIFVLVLGGVSALAIFLWRSLFWLIMSRVNKANG